MTEPPTATTAARTMPSSTPAETPRSPGSAQCSQPRGTLVIVGGEGGDPVTGMGRQLHARILSPFVRQRLTFIVNRERQSDLERLRDLVEDGTVKPALDTVYPLDQADEAVRHLIAGHTQGKLAVAVNEDATADSGTS